LASSGPAKVAALPSIEAAKSKAKAIGFTYVSLVFGAPLIGSNPANCP
jgi:hypothetical protein